MSDPIRADLPYANVAFSTRVGGVSAGPYESLNLGVLTDDGRENVDRNRELLAESVGLTFGDVAMGHQVHGAELARWDGPMETDDLQQVDGHVTSEHGLALLVLTADCLPVAVASSQRAAMLHCGWRGLAGGIVARGVDAVGEGAAAVVGPGIGGCCYEVGDEVLSAFSDVPGAADGRMLSLRAVAEARLRGAGIDDVRHVDLCTSCRADLFFSHRRDAGVTGRQGGLVWREA